MESAPPAAADGRRPGVIGHAHIEGELAQEPREAGAGITLDRDLRPRSRLAKAIEEGQALLGQDAADLLQPVPGLGRGGE